MAKTTTPARPGPLRADKTAPFRDHTAPAGGNRSLVRTWHNRVAGTTLLRPRPCLAALGLAIEGPTPLPGHGPPGSLGFGYWATAETLARTAEVWHGAAGRILRIRETPLQVHLVSARAPLGYTREAIVLGCAGDPGPASRALGHAILDMLCPELWNAAAAEADVLHPAFADLAAVLAALALPEGRSDILAQGSANLAASLATLCGRRPSAFTTALLDMVALLFAASTGRGRTADAALQLAASKTARLLFAAVRRVAIVPNLLAQFTSELAIATMEAEPAPIALALRDLFARTELLPRSRCLDGLNPYEAEDGTEIHPSRPEPTWIVLDAASLGLDRPLLVQPASQTPLLAVPRDGSGGDPLHPVAAARSFAQSLFAQDLVEAPARARRARRRPCATHRLVDWGAALRLCRIRFPCV